MSEVRKQVLAHMADVAKSAEDRGLDGIKAVMNTFPGTPVGVAVEAWCIADNQSQEEWWQSIEKTIDAETVRSAALQISQGEGLT